MGRKSGDISTADCGGTSVVFRGDDLQSKLQTERDLNVTLRQTVASQGKRIDALEEKNARVNGKVDTLKGHVEDLQDYTVEAMADLVEEVKPTTTRRVRDTALGPGF
ncbi:hypothetical protein THAR02_00934 [Trichoderma harzianum]|uniref:Uncharacterized protein n=1 Tax=Trichoderma harzianum TaxID=5544 RepID=A0A0G0AR22_TRIHA|nr:hypothetical protein THAR02_00934 [Trichoderma harzianum]